MDIEAQVTVKFINCEYTLAPQKFASIWYLIFQCTYSTYVCAYVCVACTTVRLYVHMCLYHSMYVCAYVWPVPQYIRMCICVACTTVRVSVPQYVCMCICVACTTVHMYVHMCGLYHSTSVCAYVWPVPQYVCMCICVACTTVYMTHATSLCRII